MEKKGKNAINPTREEDYSEWYQEVVKASDMAEKSPVRGCMVIKPWGYALWENLVKILDGMFKDKGVKNAYFPLFIPLSFLEKEAEHVEGFAKECAVVTHHRLESSPNGGLVPAGPLTEPLIVRPTSETIIGESFARWISSYRDLPILINQWANVVRWEMRTRIFLRTSEFLWQEGHTAHATKEEAIERTKMMLDVYAKVAEDYMAMPVIKGIKTPSERFPGAIDTMCIESMMQDKKALQSGTSHFLGQNFAISSGIKFQNAEEQEEYAWTTSWGVSTRLLGGLIMTHGDDDGIIIPPKLASSQIVIIPIFKKESDKELINNYVSNLVSDLKKVDYHGQKLGIEIDNRNIGGSRGWEWIKKGTPLRIEIGPRDIAENSVFVGKRNLPPNKKESIKRDYFVNNITMILDEIQKSLFDRALSFRNDNTHKIEDKKQFYNFFTPKNSEKPEIHGGFAFSHWCGQNECEQKIKEDLSVTIRCILLNSEEEEGKCIFCGGPSKKRVIFAKAY
ncbi:MAG: proline--tRNA ligase [Desulfobacterales bacterium]|nr:proline--tRNA ligase [Desulfobacterales bacterium]